MKAILMAIHPKWCEKIFNGEKTVEVRKVAPKLEPPFKVYAYETKRAPGTLWIDKDGHYGWRGRGMVIGEFVCDEKHDIQFTGASYMINNDISLTNSIATQSCLQFDDMFSYLGDRGGVALHITKPKLYDKPKELAAFRTPETRFHEVKWVNGHINFGSGYKGGKVITRPPQSWMYVEEIVE